MSGKGQGKGKGKGKGKRQVKRTLTKTGILERAYSRPALIRLARKAGIRRMSAKLFDKEHCQLFDLIIPFVENVARCLTLRMEACGRRTVMPEDLHTYFVELGIPMYGFGVKKVRKRRDPGGKKERKGRNPVVEEKRQKPPNTARHGP